MPKVSKVTKRTRASPVEICLQKRERLNKYLSSHRVEAIPSNEQSLEFTKSNHIVGDVVYLTYPDIYAFKLVHISEKYMYVQAMNHHWIYSMLGNSSHKLGEERVGEYYRFENKCNKKGKLCLSTLEITKLEPGKFMYQRAVR